MTDTILTIIGTAIYIPFLVQAAKTKWRTSDWTRQVLITLLTLQAITLLHIPSVVYCTAVMLLVALVPHLIIARPKVRWTPFLLFTSLYITWFAVSITWSAAPLKGWRFLLDTGVPLLAYAIGGSVLHLSREEYIRCLKTCCYAALIFVGLGIGSWLVSCQEIHVRPWDWPVMQKTFFWGVDGYRWIFRFNGGLNGYAHPSYNLLPLFAVLSLAIGLRQRAQLPAWIWWALWAGGLLLSMVAQSRMSILYSLLMPAFYIVLMQREAKRRVIAALLVAVVWIAVPVATLPFWQRLGADEIRDELTDKTLRYIQLKPITGAGAGAMNPIEICHTIGETEWPYVGYIDPEAKVSDWQPKTHMIPHNQWLADWVHAGVIAALLSLALYITAGVESIRKKRWEIGAWLVIFCIFSLLEPPLYIGKGLYLFCLICCVLSLPASSAADREACTD